MNSPFRWTVALVLVVFVPFGVVQNCCAQLGGSRASNDPQSREATLDTLSPDKAQSFITVEGKSVLSVKPTAIRIVLALTSEAESSADCKSGIDKQITTLRPLWRQVGIGDDKIVEDFISILPRYEYDLKKIDEKSMVAVEKEAGYLMQVNLHLEVKNDAEATKAIDIAISNGVTDIIGFDYWCKDLDIKKQEARAEAIEIAKEKAKVLIEGVFEKTLPVINVQEKTIVRYPASMYRSFTNSSSTDYQSNYYSRRNVPLMKLARPKNTYYEGNLPNADKQADTLPMRAELSVVSSVRIYYESPAAKTFNASRSD